MHDDGRIYQRLEALGAHLERALEGIPGLTVQRAGSIFWLCISEQQRPSTPIRTPRHFPADAAKGFAPLFHALLDGGIYLAPSAFEVGFLSAAHTEAHIDALAQALGRAATSARATGR